MIPQTCSQISQGVFESKSSKFFSFLIPFSHFHSSMLELKEMHPKAVHFVYATRIQEKHITESFSDDGEPKGSSGMPTLNVLRGENLLDIGMITVRYFGGTLLGVGGLVRAYTQSAQEAIRSAKQNNLLLPYQKKTTYTIFYPYALSKLVDYWVIKLGLEEQKRNFKIEGMEIELSSTLEQKEEFLRICQDKLGLYL